MIVSRTFLIISALAIVATVGLPAKSHRGTHGLPIPPKSLHQAVYDKDHNNELIAKRIESWKPEDKENAWELSGLFEGDIMLSSSDGDGDVTKNGLTDVSTRWPGGVVPIYIEEEDFDQDQMKLIKEAIEEYHERTCLRFRPYKETDEDWVKITGAATGCWSMVGRKGKGQELNLQKNGCLRHGTIVHELLHALGFYHQQSASDRDDYVKIHWGNIQEGKEHNFNRYDEDTVTDYGVSYDYGSVMHYSGYAFSKNKKPTITPKDKDAEIGQRQTLSEKDIIKLQAMYKEECGGRKPAKCSANSENSLIDSLGWLLD